MSFYSGFKCDCCGKKCEFSGMTNYSVISFQDLRARARDKGWLVGKDKAVCDVCRDKKKGW